MPNGNPGRRYAQEFEVTRERLTLSPERVFIELKQAFGKLLYEAITGGTRDLDSVRFHFHVRDEGQS